MAHAERDERRGADRSRTDAASSGDADWRPLGDVGERGDQGPGESPGAESSTEVRFEGVGIIGGVVALVVAAAVVVAAIVQNTDDVGFELLWFDIESPLVVLLLCSALFAVIVDQLVGLVWRRRRRELRRMRQELERRRATERTAT